jgi:hypothetical protein
MRSLRALRNEIQILTGDALKLLGFRKKGDVWLFPLGTTAASGWLGLNTVSRPDGRVGISPVIGIRHEQIESMMKELSGDPSVNAPTISASLGYLMPQARYLEWLFEDAPFHYHSECQRMVEAIEVYGISFFKSNSSLETIIGHLEQGRYTYNESPAYRLPIGYVVSGDTSAAIAYANQKAEDLGSREDEAARRYRDFVEKLLSCERPN